MEYPGTGNPERYSSIAGLQVHDKTLRYSFKDNSGQNFCAGIERKPFMISKILVMITILSLACLVYAQDCETLSENLAQDLLAGRYENVTSLFNENLARTMPANTLQIFSNSVFSSAGEFHKIAGIRSEKSGTSQVVYVTCQFDKYAVDLIISFDSENRVSSLAPGRREPRFDEKADAKAAIKTALDAAAVDEIRVVIVWGANDDRGSRSFLASGQAPAISTPAFFRNEYRTVNVDVGHTERNRDLAKGYNAALNAEALPALTVLDSNGAVIANTNADSLRPDADPSGIDPEKIALFLNLHKAPAPNAVAQFEDALKKAKKENNLIFVWFSAPW